MESFRWCSSTSCAIGNVTTGLGATVKIIGRPLTVDNTSSTANVTASEPDPNLANNSSTVTTEGRYFAACPDSFEPSFVFAGSPDLVLLIKGGGIVPVTTVTFQGTTLPTTFVDGLQCVLPGNFYPCQGVRVTVSAPLLTTPGNARVTGTNPPPGGGSCSENFRIVAPIPTPTPTTTPSPPPPTRTPSTPSPPMPTETPSPTGPAPTRTPAPEICYDCVDNDFDGAVDRDDADCPPRADGEQLGIGRPDKAAKAIVTCAKTLGRAGAKFAAARLRHFHKCVGAAFACVQQKAGDPACLLKADGVCAKDLGRSAPDGDKLRRIVRKACGTPAVEASDLRSVAGIGYETEVAVCQDRGVAALASVDDVVDCVIAQHACRVDDMIAGEVPRAAELFRLLGRDPANDFACLAADAGGSGAALGTSKGKVAVKCQKAIGNAGAKFLSVTAKITHKCLGLVYTCVQVKATDPKCVPKAVATCRTQLERLHAPGKGAAAKLRAAIGKSCSKEPLELADLFDAAGLGFGALRGECAALGVPSLESVADVTTCLERQYVCRAEQMIETETPRAVELLDVAR